MCRKLYFLPCCVSLLCAAVAGKEVEAVAGIRSCCNLHRVGAVGNAVDNLAAKVVEFACHRVVRVEISEGSTVVMLLDRGGGIACTLTESPSRGVVAFAACIRVLNHEGVIGCVFVLLILVLGVAEVCGIVECSGQPVDNGCVLERVSGEQTRLAGSYLLQVLLGGSRLEATDAVGGGIVCRCVFCRISGKPAHQSVHHCVSGCVGGDVFLGLLVSEAGDGVSGLIGRGRGVE